MEKIKKGHSRRNSVEIERVYYRTQPNTPKKNSIVDCVEEVPSLMIVPPQALAQSPPATVRKGQASPKPEETMSRTTPHGFPLKPTPYHSRTNSNQAANTVKSPTNPTFQS